MGWDGLGGASQVRSNVKGGDAHTPLTHCATPSRSATAYPLFLNPQPMQWAVGSGQWAVGSANSARSLTQYLLAVAVGRKQPCSNAGSNVPGLEMFFFVCWVLMFHKFCTIFFWIKF